MANWKTTKKIKRKERISNALLFLVAFIIFVIVFGGLCVWAIVKINEQRRNLTPSDSTSSSVSEASFSEEDIRNLLVVTIDGSDAQGFLIVRTDPTKTKTWALSFPRDTIADVDAREVKLCDLYKEQGITAVKTAMQKISGMEFHNYAVFTYPNLEKLIDHFEAGIVLNIPEKLSYSSNSMTIRMESGLRTLRASQVIDVLRYPSWQGGRKQQADMQAQVAAAMVNQFMKESRSAKADSDFGTIVNLSKTDLLVSHYANAKPGLSYLRSKNDGQICTAITLDGQYQGSGDSTRYYAAENIRNSLAATFGQTP